MKALDEIGALLASRECLILYSPLRTEVPFSEVLFLPEADIALIPARASIDPVAEANRLREFAGNRDTVILMPGRAFDALGTRLGQGGGWYDRFLATAPVEWLRIGFCFDNQLSATPLPRQPWDEPVDVVCVVDRNTKVIRVMETRARMPAFLEN